MIKIKHGLILPVAGIPEQVVYEAPAATRVGLLAADYPGLDLRLLVAGGERVHTGQPVACDVRHPELLLTAPATGHCRGDAEAGAPFTALAIDVETDEHLVFDRFDSAALATLPRERVRAQLLRAGLWPAFRTRPLDRVPGPLSRPRSIFVTAMDTRPLAARADRLIEVEQQAFEDGLAAISRLTDGLVYVCKAPTAYVPVPDIESIAVEEFAGSHPAGLAGTHIHWLDPVDRGADPGAEVWRIDYQDVIAIGRLFTGGQLVPQRVIAFGGPQAIDARLLRVRDGVDIAALSVGELRDGDTQLLSGSVLDGRPVAQAWPFLGRYDWQITALPVPIADERAWRSLGMDQFSLLPICLSRLFPNLKFRFARRTVETPRPLLATAALGRTWGLKLPQLPLLRALQAGDIAAARALGALELVAEDLALATFVCGGQPDFGALLRRVHESVAEGVQ